MFYWDKDKTKIYAEDYDGYKSILNIFAHANGRTIAAWDVLSEKEWIFLLKKRKENKYKYGLAKITTGQGAVVKGFVLLPDNWTLPNGCYFTEGIEGWWETNVYDKTRWTKMEQAGAVFMPAAGWCDGSSVFGVGNYGEWWDSAPYSLYRRGLAFMLDGVQTGGGYCGNVQGVRLDAGQELKLLCRDFAG